jgi:hypothetical protein
MLPGETRKHPIPVAPGIWTGRVNIKKGQGIAWINKTVHWEIFLPPSGLQNFPCPLSPIYSPQNWNWDAWERAETPDFTSLQGRGEWDGWKDFMEKDLRDWCQRNQLDFQKSLQAVRKSVEEQAWWKDVRALGVKLPEAREVCHVHPWRFLENLRTLNEIISPKDWEAFRCLCVLVKTSLENEVPSQELCRALAQAFLDRQSLSDWSHCKNIPDLAEDLLGHAPTLPAWNKLLQGAYLPSPSMQRMVFEFLRPRNHDIRWPLFHLRSRDRADMPWNQVSFLDSVRPSPVGPMVFYPIQPGSPIPTIHPGLYISYQPFPCRPGDKIQCRLVFTAIAPEQCNQLSTDCTWVVSDHQGILCKENALRATPFSYTLKKSGQAEFLLVDVSIRHGLGRLHASVQIPTLYPPWIYCDFLHLCLRVKKQSFPIDFPPSPHVFDRKHLLNIQKSRHAECLVFGQMRSITIHPNQPVIQGQSMLAPQNPDQLHCWLRDSNQWSSLIEAIEANGVQDMETIPKTGNHSPNPSPFLVQTPAADDLPRIRALLLGLGYWCDHPLHTDERPLRHPLSTFQAEWGLKISGIPTPATLHCLVQAKSRPGIGNFHQLRSPPRSEYIRYGEIIAIPQGNDQRLQGIAHNELWGVKAMVDALQTLLLQWHRDTQDPIHVGDLSLYCGGTLSPHRSHKTGTSVDCRSPSVGAYQIQGASNPRYSVELTERFCLRARALGFGTIYTLCPVLLSRIGPGTANPCVKEMEGHQHHLHLEYTG